MAHLAYLLVKPTLSHASINKPMCFFALVISGVDPGGGSVLMLEFNAASEGLFGTFCSVKSGCLVVFGAPVGGLFCASAVPTVIGIPSPDLTAFPSASVNTPPSVTKIASEESSTANCAA